MKKITNQKEFIERMVELYARNTAISKAKNSDYAGDGDPFQNFKAVEFLSAGKITAEQAIIVRLTDKLQRATNLLFKEASVKDESLADTLSDMANYAMILRMYLENKN